MSNEYYAVILEFNSREIKLGFVGEASEHVKVNSESPLWRKLVPRTSSTASLPAFLEVDSHAISTEIQNEILQNLEDSEVYKELCQAYQRDKKDLKWFDWDLDNYLTLATLVKALLSTKLLIQPLKTKLFVLDSPFPAAKKSLLCKTFLNTKAVVAITFLPFSPCCCIASGVENALVVSMDWNSCKLIPVLDLRSLPPREFVQFSGESMHYSPSILHDSKTFQDIELEIQKCNSVVEEILFSENCLPVKIADFVKTLQIDSRACVVGNIIFTGLRSQIPGVKGRLLTEIASNLPGLNVSGKVCLGSWTGASLYCSTTLLKMKSTEWKHMEISKLGFDKTAAKTLETYES